MTIRRLPVLETAWAVLVIATLVSYWIGVQRGDLAAALLIAVAFVKVRIIGTYFMDLATAPRGLSRVFDAYVGVVGLALIVLYLVL